MSAPAAGPRFALSATQESMVAATWRDARAGFAIEQLVIECREELAVEPLRRAFAAATARHEALRASFPVVDGRFQQELAPHAELPFEVLDFSGEPDPGARWDEHLAADRARGFTLGAAPLQRVAVIRRGPRDGAIVWTFHHALLDGLAMAMVLAEILDEYEHRRDGRAFAAIERPAYRAYLGWLAAQASAPGLAFWDATLAAAASPLATLNAGPPDRVPAARSPAVAEALLTADATELLARQAAALGITVNTLVQGAWAMLMARYGDQEQVAFAAMRACRHFPVAGAALTIGNVVNTVPVVVEVPPTRVAGDWLRELRAGWIAMRPFEHVPLAAIQRQQAAAGRALAPGCNVNFARTGLAALEREGRRVRLHEHSDFPVTLAVEGGARLRLQLAYWRDTFADGAMARALAHLQVLLRTLGGEPGRPLAQVDLLTAEERRGAIRRGPAASADDACVHHLVEAQVARTPDAVALVSGESALSYRELDQRAEALARHLLERGARGVIGVCLPRSPGWVVALLGVWKAGSAYLPLDPAAPAHRLETTLRAADARVLIVDGAGRAPPGFAGQVIALEAAIEAGAVAAASLPRGRPDQLAYVMPTSGTTGEPKLVEVEQGSVVNLLRYAQSALLRPADLAVVPLTDVLWFDSSVSQIWNALIAGGQLVLVDGIEALPRSPHWARFTTFGTTPSILETLLVGAGLPPAVRVVGLGAEVVPEALLARLRSAPTVERVINYYGPTEATVYGTAAVLFDRARGLALAGGRVVGAPIAGVTVRLLDRRGEPVPDGVMGELYLGGAGVARGYRGRPDLDQGAFLTEVDETGAPHRRYRTGDLARVREDGQLEFCGRRDRQVKLNGVRVQLEEIEAVLRQHPGVRWAQARTLARAGRSQLIAYFAAERALPAAELRGFLAARLPAGMRPAELLAVDELPLTAQGKVDGARLPVPAARAPGAGGFRDELERSLRDLWSDVLGHTQFGPDDDFSAAGGDSLGMVTMMLRLQATRDGDLSFLRTVQPLTVRALAEQMRRPPPAPAAAGARLFWCLNNPRELATLQRTLAAAPAASGDVNITFLLADPRGSVDEQAERQVQTILREQERGPYHVAGYCLSSLLAFEIAVRLERRGHALGVVVLFDNYGPEPAPPIAVANNVVRVVKSAVLDANERRRLTSRGLQILRGGPAHVGRWLAPKSPMVARAYRPSGALQAPLELVVSTATEAEEARHQMRDAAQAWRRWAKGPVAQRRVSGAHMAAVGPDGIRALVEIVHRHTSTSRRPPA
jgi:amino acid adenylation domain-containing protein